ncbi:DUF3263 domain-containing protein [Propionicicella superfundia]|uniref:DUF3263 domain-containing protein n=1 Tax=Propionicicella superfundia TaxID=348582 RepID=UPI000406DAEF|nr:DUF3263 domain-containing protein [Propionicicella superfundia]
MAQPVHSSETTDLAPLGKDILAFERSWWAQSGAKERGIRDRFDLTPTRYYQLLNELIDDPAALVEDPLLVKRLRRLREQRRLARSAARLETRVQ